MNIQFSSHKNRAYNNSSNGDHVENVDQFESFQGVVEWLNHMLPSLNMPVDDPEDELITCLMDGTVLCSILSKISPSSNTMVAKTHSGQERVRRFLEAMDEMGLPGFDLSDLHQGNLMPILHCLKTLEAQFNFDDDEESIQNPARSLTNENHLKGIPQARGNESVNGQLDPSDVKVLELLNSNKIESSSTQSLFGVVNRMLDESIGTKNGDIHQHVALLLRKAVRVIEHRFSTQADNLKKQNNVYKAREEKYQSRLKTLETLAMGTIGENEVVMNVLHQIKVDKSKLEEKEKLEEQDVTRLKKEKHLRDEEILMLKLELDSTRKTHKNHCLDLEAQAEKTKVDLDRKIKELECVLRESRVKVKELESFSESKYRRWKKKERVFRGFIEHQCGALQDMREAFESIKYELLKTKRSYAEEFNYLGVKLKLLVDAAENYQTVLAENRRLYNEVQDLKGNIRVYCRVRPFLHGQSKKQTTIEHFGENGELIVANPLKPGKDSHKLFKFNKVFGPSATQEEVFLDTQPLIRSVLDGYNVCIFAYGQTGSGKTYTMSGPSVMSKEWGVNYRALNDLFEISQSRKSCIVYEVGVQMVEIYNEQVRDLLLNGGSQRKLGIWNTSQPNGLAVPDASMHAVRSTSDVLELMHIGLMNRAVGATALNERSSRSHSVLTVHVRGTELKTGAILRGNLHLVDLAGSERVDRSEVTGDRLREAQHINKSLSALGDVIFALAQKSQHVPYRNSKLTQVLQSSLGGQAKTLMFVQLNPDAESYSETVSTLKFAERVSGVELGAARSNKEGKDVRGLIEQVSSLKGTIAKNEAEIERLQHKVQVNGLKHSSSSQSLTRYESASPRRHSIGSPRLGRKLSRGEFSGRSSDKAASDMDNCSEYSDKNSEVGSQQLVDEIRHHHHKESRSQSKLVGRNIVQNLNEDTDLLRFGEVDSDERLSDISDGDLSMGTETDGSMSSLVEFTLFPESAKQVEKVGKQVEKVVKQVEKVENTGNFSVPTTTKIPKPPSRGAVQTKPPRLSLNKSSSAKVPSSALGQVQWGKGFKTCLVANLKGGRKTVGGSFSATKSSGRWQ